MNEYSIAGIIFAYFKTNNSMIPLENINADNFRDYNIRVALYTVYFNKGMKTFENMEFDDFIDSYEEMKDILDNEIDFVE